MKKNRLAYLEWIDSMQTHGWQLSNVESLSAEDMTCKSFGFVFAEDAHSITITSSLSSQGGPASLMQIPKIAITEFLEIPIEDLLKTEQEE